LYTDIDFGKKPLFLPFIDKNKGPCFSLDFRDTGEYTMDCFLKALRCERPEDAALYISKNYLDRIDLEELSDVLLTKSKLCVSYVLKTAYHENPKNCIDKAFLVMDNGKAELFSISMLKEPDRFGKWKIYSIDREEALQGSII